MRHSRFTETTEVEIFLFNGENSQKEVFEAITNTKPQVVGFSCYVWNSLTVLKIVKKRKREIPDTKMALGGTDDSPRGCSLMKKHDFIDVTVIGEGEESFTALLHAWFSGELVEAFEPHDKLTIEERSRHVLSFFLPLKVAFEP